MREEIRIVFASCDESAEVVKPADCAFDFPPSAVTGIGDEIAFFSEANGHRRILLSNPIQPATPVKVFKQALHGNVPKNISDQ
jgi:hypothetical protein